MKFSLPLKQNKTTKTSIANNNNININTININNAIPATTTTTKAYVTPRFVFFVLLFGCFWIYNVLSIWMNTVTVGQGISQSQQLEQEQYQIPLSSISSRKIIQKSFTMIRDEMFEQERTFVFQSKKQQKQSSFPSIYHFFTPTNKLIKTTKDNNNYHYNAQATKHTKYLLDYVIAGFAKCGTTALGEWFKQHDTEIITTSGERMYNDRRVDELIKWAYKMKKQSVTTTTITNSNTNSTNSSSSLSLSLPKLVGYKFPHFIQGIHQLALLKEPYFSYTKLIISVRHPIKWFESYYNYRMEANETHLLQGSPNELIGDLQNCTKPGCKAHWVLSTSKAAFHYYLAGLQKTNLFYTNNNNNNSSNSSTSTNDNENNENDNIPYNEEEMALLRPFGPPIIPGQKQVPKTVKIFFIEMNQLKESTTTTTTTTTKTNHDIQQQQQQRQLQQIQQQDQLDRNEIFRLDMQEFLGLSQPFLQSVPKQVRPGEEERKKQQQLGDKNNNASNHFTKINICDDEYIPVRTELLYISRNASIWFRNYFLKSDDVYVSSPEYVYQILETEWMKDPCEGNEMEKK